MITADQARAHIKAANGTFRKTQERLLAEEYIAHFESELRQSVQQGKSSCCMKLLFYDVRSRSAHPADPIVAAQEICQLYKTRGFDSTFEVCRKYGTDLSSDSDCCKVHICWSE